MLLFYLSLPFYLKNSNFLYWMVPYHTQIYPDKISGCKNWYFWCNWKKCDFACFGNVSTRYNINDCVHSKITIFYGRKNHVKDEVQLNSNLELAQRVLKIVSSIICLEEVQYNSYAHRSAYLLITTISSHNPKVRKQPQRIFRQNNAL